MKKLLLILFIITSCTDTKPPNPEPISEKPEIKLAWDNQEWTDHLQKEIDKKTWALDIKTPCKLLTLKECLAQALSIMAKYESNFKPETKYTESFNDAKGNKVISRGLFQLSIESANQEAYACNIKKAEELHDPLVNITCMVNIANHWLNKDKVFFGGEKLGLGRYHSTGRSTSKSNISILKYMEKF